MIARLLSSHVSPMLTGSGVGIILLHYAFNRIPLTGVGAGFALVIGGFLVWAIFSEED